MRDSADFKDIYRRTDIVRRPTYGIVSGYHTLPYVCLGDAVESGYETTEVRGTIQVSPRFLIRPSYHDSSYEDIFGEEHVEQALVGRVFGFLGFRGKPVECKSDHISVRHLTASPQRVLAEVLDELERYEDITTGVIVTPNSRYFPVSIERFIASILDDEFRM